MTSSPNLIPDLAKRYREYREKLRHNSPADRSELHNWNGPFHRVMTQLGESLGSGRHTSKELISLLGRPDKTLPGGANHFSGTVPRNQTYLIYEWRGSHDYLYFIIQNGTVVSSKWWFAGE